ncbi:3-methyladenine DNA glycosylase [Rhodococcus sp. WB9]|uniref:3-methyladenine DNA glycosylase n=1 Tax=Rhodococcus sp. WB9 TaxID=2594007 RepID=UPI001185490A|nr:3-methyladenine DNA glycosylase [Rhodococcus sp. WB9]QDQ92568.1 3-methyladenine DNA glycosylase [Rhodococcus sp. WB9]
MDILDASEWIPRRDRHRARVSALIKPHLERRERGETHPVIDFLFTYYSYRPNQLLRWNPGWGTVLAGGDEYAELRGYHRTDAGVTVDPEFLKRRSDTVAFTRRLMEATAGRPAHLSCFGLHEWAMVYRSDEVRHDSIPLRLGPGGTDSVVESLHLRCTHYDAFRFFTPAAEPRNSEPLTREDQLGREQPGCLHASMDLYKYCYKLAPMIDSDLTVDCFELALAARELDMRASPYDLTAYGYTPIPIETPHGRAEYVREQSALAARAAPLRAALRDRCRRLLATVSP